MPMKASKTKMAIEELMEKAEFHADESLHVGCNVTPTLYIRCHDGTTTGYTLGDEINDKNKKALATNTGLMCLAHGAEAAVLCIEAGMRRDEKCKTDDLSAPAAGSSEQQEIVILLGESREESFQRVLPILRMDDGQYFRFGKERDIHEAKVEGQIGTFLSAEIPDEQARQEAKSVLEAQGIFPINGKKRGRELGMAWF